MQDKIERDFLGNPVREPIFTPGNQPYMIDVKVTFDPETGSTTPDESNKVDLVALIQTYKDQCGMELAKKLLKNGQADAADFADDGKHSFELPEDLDTAQGRANAAILARAQAEAFAEKFGVPAGVNLSEEQLAAIIAKTIETKYPDLIKKEEAKPDAE